MGTREGGEDTRSRPAWGARRCTESADAGSLGATSARRPRSCRPRASPLRFVQARRHCETDQEVLKHRRAGTHRPSQRARCLAAPIARDRNARRLPRRGIAPGRHRCLSTKAPALDAPPHKQDDGADIRSRRAFFATLPWRRQARIAMQ
ncbi:hypothetical protein GLA29479_5145 [Lysobacter antibioticus]|nr:hypothetical protein GLA29479_5145 [Lysobacter antibioticus]